MLQGILMPLDSLYGLFQNFVDRINREQPATQPDDDMKGLVVVRFSRVTVQYQ